LLKKFSSPPQPLLELREPINRTLLEIFSAGSGLKMQNLLLQFLIGAWERHFSATKKCG